MFRVNSGMDEVSSLPDPSHREVVGEVEDYFQRKRWVHKGAAVSLSRHKKDMVACWVFDAIADVVTVGGMDRLSFGLFHSATGHYAPKLYAGVKSHLGPHVALRKVPYRHKRPLEDMLRQWRDVAWYCESYVLGMRNRPVSKAEMQELAFKCAAGGVLPWVRAGNLLGSKDEKTQWTSWSALGAFQRAIESGPPTKQMDRCLKFVKLLPLNKEWVSLDEEEENEPQQAEGQG